MQTAYLDDTKLTARTRARLEKRTQPLQDDLLTLHETPDPSRPEYALTHGVSDSVASVLTAVSQRIGKVRQVVLIGTGGSSLGVEAVHAALGGARGNATELLTLDVLTPSALAETIERLRRLRSCHSLAICVISKSGTTAETVVNAAVLLDALEDHFGMEIYERVVAISDPGSPLLRYTKRQGGLALTMPDSVGGRYSVGTEVGLVPLQLLGHDATAFAQGLQLASSAEQLPQSAAAAARLAWYITIGYRHYNIFAFHPDLFTLGAWYRQLQAESLGKAVTRSGKAFRKGLVPTISTPTELHSMGQLYLSGFPGVYTDFVAYEDESTDQSIPRRGLAQAYASHSVADVATALYGGVLAAYQDQQLPYRSTLLPIDAMAIGQFMGARMSEVIMAADLLDLNPFDQPNVELYKRKTRSILGL